MYLPAMVLRTTIKQSTPPHVSVAAINIVGGRGGCSDSQAQHGPPFSFRRARAAASDERVPRDSSTTVVRAPNVASTLHACREYVIRGRSADPRTIYIHRVSRLRPTRPRAQSLLSLLAFPSFYRVSRACATRSRSREAAGSQQTSQSSRRRVAAPRPKIRAAPALLAARIRLDPPPAIPTEDSRSNSHGPRPRIMESLRWASRCAGRSRLVNA